MTSHAKNWMAASAVAIAVTWLPAYADTRPPDNPDDYVCQFEDLPPMHIQRRTPSDWILRIGDALPVKLSVGSAYAIAEFQGQELTFWEDGQSVRIADVLFKGECR
jgi:hypothetical protein